MKDSAYLPTGISSLSSVIVPTRFDYTRQCSLDGAFLGSAEVVAIPFDLPDFSLFPPSGGARDEDVNAAVALTRANAHGVREAAAQQHPDDGFDFVTGLTGPLNSRHVPQPSGRLAPNKCQFRKHTLRAALPRRLPFRCSPNVSDLSERQATA
jgi:hypothetical protein